MKRLGYDNRRGAKTYDEAMKLIKLNLHSCVQVRNVIRLNLDIILSNYSFREKIVD